MSCWQIGNTTVRSAMRLKDGLEAYASNPSIEGKIRNVEGDMAFRDLLGKAGIVRLGEDETVSVGRKWRSAMAKLGFLYPEVSRIPNIEQKDIEGQIDFITPAGRALIDAENLPAKQECFLRALVAPTLDLDPLKKTLFSPLVWTLAILLDLEERNSEARLSFWEFGCFVQTSDPSTPIPVLTGKIIAQREERQVAPNKKVFNKELVETASQEAHCSTGTVKDYADMNIRYLKATGVIRGSGQGIELVPVKRDLAKQLIANLISTSPKKEVYAKLHNGYPLPTDNLEFANAHLTSLRNALDQVGVHIKEEPKLDNSNIQSVNNVRSSYEILLQQKNEETYAKKQYTEWEDIRDYLYALRDGKPAGLYPKSEAPAYLEWSIWRAFLAMNSLKNQPYDVRNFQVDMDFTPLGTAPGGRPDLLAVYEDYLIVIEVTLSENSRQEAMEGEPVRRHVAQILEDNPGKAVYGLFIAKKIDTNTIETFRHGTWYDKNDTKKNLKIIPLTIDQFTRYFEAMFQHSKIDVNGLVALMDRCQVNRPKLEAPAWRLDIADRVADSIAQF